MLKSICWAAIVCMGWGMSAIAGEKPDQHVLLISVDGLPAYYIDDPQASLPNIRSLLKTGARAEGMRVSNPSVTWPNHTTLVTGVPPARHGVLFNGVLARKGLGMPVRVNPDKDFAELVAVPTLFHAVKKQGGTTAGINWPCTRNLSEVDDNFPDVPRQTECMTERLKTGLVKSGRWSQAELDRFSKSNVVVRDRLWTDAACHVIVEQRPTFMAVHLLVLDAVHHGFGPRSLPGYTAAAYADACIGRMLAALDTSGIRKQTAVIVVSDHGFMAVPKKLEPNVLLRKAGLLSVSGKQVTAARVHAIPEGGIAMLYLTVPENKDEQRKQVKSLFEGQEGIVEVLGPEKFAEYGLPQPGDHPGMADLILVGKDGYQFGGGAAGEDFVTVNKGNPGTHGFLSTNPKMNAVFIAAGQGVKPGAKLETIGNIDVAPTIARLLGARLENPEGRVLSEILAGE